MLLGDLGGGVRTHYPYEEIAPITPGPILYELGGVTEEQAKVCFARLAHKMPVRVRLARRRLA